MKIKNSILICLSLILCCSCFNNTTEGIDNELVFIDSLKVYNPSSETVGSSKKLYNNRRKRVIVYIDGNCFNCAQDFMFWKEIMQSTRKNHVDYVFYLYVNEFEKIRPYFRKWRFYHPVLIDTRNTFSTINKLSSGNQAIIVDENNTIIYKGRPAENKEDNESLLKFLSDRLPI